MKNKPDFGKTVLGEARVVVFDQSDPKYAPLLLTKKPPTLRQKQQEYGGAKGKEVDRHGKEYDIDLSQYADRDPDTTFVMVTYALPQLDDLHGRPLNEALSEARRRMGM